MSGWKSQALGRWGEALAAEFLRKRGFTVAASGWRCRYGELDLIAEDGEFLCFVEVKLRGDGGYGAAAEAVGRRKQGRLRAAALTYLEQNPTGLQPRFDVMEIYAPRGMDTREPEIAYLTNAF